MAFAAHAASALVIDDFEEGPFTVVEETATSSGGTRAEQSGLDTSHVVGGVRLVYARVTGLPEGVAGAVLSPSGSLDDGAVLTAAPGCSVTFQYDAMPSDPPSAAFTAGGLGLDLTGYSAIEITAAEVSTGAATARIWLWSSNGASSTPVPIVEGVNVLPLAEFSAARLADVRQLDIQIEGISPVDSLRILHVAAVSGAQPPPGSGLPAPELIAPASGAVVPAGAPTFSWTAVDGAGGYRVAVATSVEALPDEPTATACAGCAIDASAAAPSYAHAAGLAPSTVHWWQVQGLPGGDWSPPSLFTTSGAVALQITEPEAGAAIEADALVVRGLAMGPGVDFGIEVNGVVTLRDASQFGAQVPVLQPIELLTATARDATGQVVARHAIPVSVVPADEAPVVSLSVAPDMGTVPFTAHFGFTSEVAPTLVTFDADGNGTPDSAGPTFDDRSFTYATPGLYEPTVTVVAEDGTTHSASTLVRVFGVGELDLVLLPKWRAIKEALRAGNVPAALEHVLIRRRTAYADVLSNLTIPLAEIDQELTELVFELQLGRHVDYEMHRDEDGEIYSYPVTFTLDEDGIWRLGAF